MSTLLKRRLDAVFLFSIAKSLREKQRLLPRLEIFIG